MLYLSSSELYFQKSCLRNENGNTPVPPLLGRQSNEQGTEVQFDIYTEITYTQRTTLMTFNQSFMESKNGLFRLPDSLNPHSPA